MSHSNSLTFNEDTPASYITMWLLGRSSNRKSKKPLDTWVKKQIEPYWEGSEDDMEHVTNEVIRMYQDLTADS